MTRRTAWTAVFVAVTAAAITMELIAAADADPNKVTWTELISAWVPQTVTMAAIALLTAWLGPHFTHAYQQRGDEMEPIPVPPSREADARNRAVRTFWQGLLIDVTVALLVTIGPALIGSDFAVTAAYWQTLGVLAAKTVVAAAVSYLMRKLVPPQFEPARQVRPAAVEPLPTKPAS